MYNKYIMKYIMKYIIKHIIKCIIMIIDLELFFVKDDVRQTDVRMLLFI